MHLPTVATSEEWQAARDDLQVREDELARARDAANEQRRRLPMVEVGRDYTFVAPYGRVGLPDLFDGRGQLLVYHFWFQPGEEPCEGCTSWVRNLGHLPSLHERDTTLAMVSPASSAEIEAVRAARGWTVPWFSLAGTGFNDDMGYTGIAQITVFVRDDEKVYRTYATSGRVLETLSNQWSLLALTPAGAG